MSGAAHPHSRQTLAFLFWPEPLLAQARTNGRTLLQRLRAALLPTDACLSLEPQAVAWCK